ncbi:hypothetical protein [Neolewinella litorea]|uniref:Uncharacterized protein n=1 Tax=Neolewinella litorea TaxID=2562452 RepID=A0A4S4N571_9BACT|nr:hypothetical protein [Neolewinella litorea]THH34212.1 hypothetical protein E4021_17930 [Neolewinella litorea]
MFRYLLVLTCVAIFSADIFSQDAPKGANVIEIHTADNIDDAFKKMGRLLLDEGYTLETADKNFYVITTEVRKMNYGFMNAGELEMKLIIEFNDDEDGTTMILKGMKSSEQLHRAATTGAGVSSNTSFDKDASRILNKGGKGSIVGASWIFMENLAKGYKGGKIEYLTEETR